MKETHKQLVEYLMSVGYSQTQISEFAGCSQATISRLLSGRHADTRTAIRNKLDEMKVRYQSGQVS